MKPWHRWAHEKTKPGGGPWTTLSGGPAPPPPLPGCVFGVTAKTDAGVCSTAEHRTGSGTRTLPEHQALLLCKCMGCTAASSDLMGRHKQSKARVGGWEGRKESRGQSDCKEPEPVLSHPCLSYMGVDSWRTRRGPLSPSHRDRDCDPPVWACALHYGSRAPAVGRVGPYLETLCHLGA